MHSDRIGDSRRSRAFRQFSGHRQAPGPDQLAGYHETALSVRYRDVPLPLHIWERVRDLPAILEHLENDPPLGMRPDMDRVASAWFSALSIAGVRVSRAAFIDDCDRHARELDRGWMQAASVDFATIDQAACEADYRGPRIKVMVSIDPALPQLMTGDSLTAVPC